MAKIYEQLQQMLNDESLSPRTRRGINWLRSKVEELYGDQKLTHKDMIKTASKVLQPSERRFVGKMYMFRYIPEGRNTLPYYDRYPLIFILNMYRDGFLGLNLHYLPPKLRTDLLLGLDRYRSNDKYDETTRLRISYELIRDTARLYSGLHIIKRYKKRMIKSNIIQVLPNEWAMASLLPTESFVGSSKNQVWADTRKKL